MTAASVDGHIVRLRGITRTYASGAGTLAALRGVDLDLPRGVLAALKGRSGSGKTTLLNIIGGLDQPDSGEVVFDGRRLADLSEAERLALRRRQIGFVFQSFGLLPTYSALENVELALRISGTAWRERAGRARECLELVGLERWARHRPPEMSGGQQQRLAIARALAPGPALILADEPTGELDTATSREVYRLLRGLVDRAEATILVATHDPQVDEFADIFMLLEDGQLALITNKP
jgi:putative ABC transport system ATP-binding protein